MRKKISLITIFDVANFGTYLQALATAVTIQKMGCKTEIVHYERPFKNTKLLRRPVIIRWIYYLYFKLRGFNGILFTYRCRNFVSKYTKITKPYFSIKQLMQHPPQADIYMTGSDQVWNTDYNRGIEEAYYLSYVPKGKKKVAYAASIGQDYIREEFKARTKELLSKYDSISVRESKAVELLADIGITATHVLDPTLLLNRKQWLEFTGERLVKKDYLLVYSVEPTEYDGKVAEVAERIAKAKNLKIISVSNYGEDKRIPGCVEYFDFALPQDFLSLMAHASFVVASSFHGTAFAINFNRQFLTITPGVFSSRIASLLDLTGLSARRISGISDVSDSLIRSEIEYDHVNKILNDSRDNSLRFMQNIL